jgi:hypothetical protein
MTRLEMATYKEIQDYVKNKYGFVPKTCWIADVREICGLPVRKAGNRSGERSNPCPPEKIEAIKDAFKHFKMV